MNFDSPTVRKILDDIRKDPADGSHWHHLLVACFDQKDSESFETYQIIAEALDQLAKKQNDRSVRGRTSRILLTSAQKEALYRLACQPLDIHTLTEVGRLLLEDFSRPAEAGRLFERAHRLAPSDADLVRWIEQCRNGSQPRPALAEDILPQDAPSGPLRSLARADVRRLMRMTSAVHPRLLGPSPTPAIQDAALPAPVTPSETIVPAENSKRQLLAALDALLDALIKEDLAQITAALPEVEKQAQDPITRGLALTLAARTLHRKADHEAALHTYQRALHALPEIASLHFAQASIYHELGRFEDAKNVYRGVISRFPRHDRAWANLGALHYHLGELTEAEACYRRALEIQPEAPAIWNDFASILTDRGQHPQALDALAEVIARAPHHPEAWLKRGLLLLEQNDLPAACEAIEHHITLHGASPLALTTMAIIQARSGESSEALHICQQLPDDPATAAARANAWMETALAFEQNDDFSQALDCLQQSAAIESANYAVWMRIGQICRRNQALDQAASAFLRAAELAPDQVLPWSELALTRYKMEQFAEAAEAFERAFSLFPEQAELSYNAGVAWEKAGRLPEAAAAYQRTITLQADHASARINLSQLYMQSNQPEKAISCLQGLVLVRPDYARAWFALGLIYEDIRQWNEAIRCLEKAIMIDASLREVWTHLAYVYRKEGREDDARRALLNAQPLTSPDT